MTKQFFRYQSVHENNNAENQTKIRSLNVTTIILVCHPVLIIRISIHHVSTWLCHLMCSSFNRIYGITQGIYFQPYSFEEIAFALETHSSTFPNHFSVNFTAVYL